MKQRMTKAFPILLALLLFAAALSFGALAEDEGPALDGALTMDVPISDKNFPDAAFQTYVRETFDTDGSGTLSTAEIDAVTAINCQGRGIADLAGLSYFKKLADLNCSRNDLTKLVTTGNTALLTLDCSENDLTALGVSSSTQLLFLNCAGNALTSLDVTGNTALLTLDCSGNQLTALDVTKNTALETLLCGGNNLTSLDVSQNAALGGLTCSDASLQRLDVSHNTELMYLDCSNNNLTSLNVSKNPSLSVLRCQGNRIPSLALDNCPALVDAITRGTQTAADSAVTYALSINVLTADSQTKLIYTATGVALDEAHFPDAGFRSALAACDADSDDLLSAAEIAAVTRLVLADRGITSLEGIEYLTSLAYLDCTGNAIQTLDVRWNIALEELYCPSARMTDLLLGDNVELRRLDCSGNNLSTLDITGCPALLDAVRYGEESSEGGIITYRTSLVGASASVLIYDEKISLYIGGSVSILGDLNGDETVDARDAAILLGILLRGDDLPANADVTQNGTVTLLDAVQMLRFHTNLTNDMASVSDAGE